MTSTDSSGLFDVRIISDPGAALNPNDKMWSVDMVKLREYDEHLVKPALLFADSVELLTGRADMLSVVNSQDMEIGRMPMRRLGNFLGLSLRRDPEELKLLGVSVSDLASREDAEIFFNPKKRNVAKISKLEQKYWTQIVIVTDATLEVLRRRREALVSDRLQEIADRGLLKTAGWSGGLDDEWSLAWRPQAEFFSDTVREMTGRLSAATGAVMFEPGAQFLLSQSGKSEAPVASPVNSDASSPSSLASSFLSRLPGMREVGLDEVIDMREDLSPYLIPFRAAMAELSHSISNRSDESVRAEDEIERRWQSEIRPTIHEIEFRMRRGNYPRQLLTAFSDDKGALAATASSVVLATGSIYAGVSALIPAAAAAAVPFVKALNSALRHHDELQENRMFFLYRAGRLLKP